jgi:hypothetical protein
MMCDEGDCSFSDVEAILYLWISGSLDLWISGSLPYSVVCLFLKKVSVYVVDKHEDEVMSFL